MYELAYQAQEALIMMSSANVFNTEKEVLENNYVQTGWARTALRKAD